MTLYKFAITCRNNSMSHSDDVIHIISEGIPCYMYKYTYKFVCETSLLTFYVHVEVYVKSIVDIDTISSQYCQYRNRTRSWTCMPTSKDDVCQVWLKLAQLSWRRRLRGANLNNFPDIQQFPVSGGGVNPWGHTCI
jgi:hypothetical protein